MAHKSEFQIVILPNLAGCDGAFEVALVVDERLAVCLPLRGQLHQLTTLILHRPLQLDDIRVSVCRREEKRL